MNRITIPFELGTFHSKEDGNARVYRMDEGLIEVFGQAKTLLFNSFVYEKSANDAGAKLRVYHSSLSSGWPDEVGEEVGSGYDVSAEGATIVVVDGPFCGRVLVTLEVVDTSGTPAAQKLFRMEVGATLVLD